MCAPPPITPPPAIRHPSDSPRCRSPRAAASIVCPPSAPRVYDMNAPLPLSALPCCSSGRPPPPHARTHIQSTFPPSCFLWDFVVSHEQPQRRRPAPTEGPPNHPSSAALRPCRLRAYSSECLPPAPPSLLSTPPLHPSPCPPACCRFRSACLLTCLAKRPPTASSVAHLFCCKKID